MLKGAGALGDPRSGADWKDEFKGDIDGVFLITGDQQTTVDERLDKIKNIVNLNTGKTASIDKVIEVVGKVRPEPNKGHEQYITRDKVQ